MAQRRFQLIAVGLVGLSSLSGCAAMGPPVPVLPPFYVGESSNSALNTPGWIQMDVNSLTTAFGEQDQYVMEHPTLFGPEREFVYVAGGKVVAIQNY